MVKYEYKDPRCKCVKKWNSYYETYEYDLNGCKIHYLTWEEVSKQ